MPTIFYAGATAPGQVIADDTTVVFLPGSVMSGSNFGIRGEADMATIVQGTVAVTDAAIDFGDTTVFDDSHVEVMAGGSVLSTDNHAVFVHADQNTIINSGSITAPSASAILAYDDLNLQNFGSISSGGIAGVLLTDSSLAAPPAVSPDHVINNHGNISGGIGVAVVVGHAVITNTGTISGNQQGVATGIYGSATLVNSGVISGADRSFVSTSYSSENVTNQATGVMVGDLEFSDFADELTNAGQIDGDVNLFSGADTFDGRGGTVTGTVQGGAGSDIFYIDQVGAVIDGDSGTDTAWIWSTDVDATDFEEIYLMGGEAINIDGTRSDDHIRGNNADNAITGGIGGQDTLLGNGGDDYLAGGDDRDSIRGGAGDDEILGEGGRDTLRGHSGNDYIDGGFGNDSILAGAGDDTIIGGRGTDDITPGNGADVIIWASATDMDGDVVNGFQPGADVIDLSDIEPGSFAFLGTSAFTAGGGMELRYAVDGSGDARVQIDVDGDGVSDAQANFIGTTSLLAEDFVL